MKFFRFFLLSLAFIGVLVVLFTVFIHPFLSVNNPTQSRNLVIEAWLSGNELEEIIEKSESYNLENIFVVGKKFKDDRKCETKLSDFEVDDYFRWHKHKNQGVLLLTNSSFLVDFSKLGIKERDSIKTISVTMSDTKKNNIYAHFNLSLNGSLLGSSFVNDTLTEYSYNMKFESSGHDFLSIYFDNDYYSPEESRNLYINSISINDFNYELSELNSLITRHESLLTTGFFSEATQTAQYLKDLNVNPEIINILEFDVNGNNQTMASALKLKEHFKDNPPKDLNISSAGLHARRSLLTYQKVLNIEKIGVFNIPIKTFNHNNWYKSGLGIQRMLDEFVSYIYVWFYLNFN